MGNFDYESGRRFLADGEIEEGIRCFLASLDTDPAHTPTYLELFRAYDAAWHQTWDPMVLDQMRKVAIAGLKRKTTERQRRFLEEALDRTEQLIVEVQSEEEELQREQNAKRRVLPLITAQDD